jgi:hypothetical protein
MRINIFTTKIICEANLKMAQDLLYKQLPVYRPLQTYEYEKNTVYITVYLPADHIIGAYCITFYPPVLVYRKKNTPFCFDDHCAARCLFL